MNRKTARAAQRLKLTRYAKWINVPEFEGVRIEIRACTYHDLLELREMQLDENDLDFWPIMNRVISGWDLQDDDGAAIPFDQNTVREIPMLVIRAMIAAAMAVIQGAAEIPLERTSSPASSTASPPKGA